MIQHRCQVPGCEFVLDVPVIQVPVGEDLAEYARKVYADTDATLFAHLRSHFIPEQPGEPPTIHSLTDADGEPAVKFGPDVAAMILVTSGGMCQIIGRDGVDHGALGEAISNAGRYLLNDSDWANDPVPEDRGPRLNRIPTALPHVGYPHEPGRLHDCMACMAACHCDTDEGSMVCVYEGIHHKRGHRNPYVGSGSEGARRSAQIDREEADCADRDDPARGDLLESAERWDRQAADLEAVDQ